MIRDLTEVEMKHILRTQYYGRLGCSDEKGKMYIVPITYAFQGDAIYIFSFEGKKTHLLRMDPNACLQVEELTNPLSWRSVIIWGTYEELAGKEREEALTLIIGRLWEEGAKGKSLYMPFRNSEKKMEEAIHGKNVVLYRIRIEEMTGRMEQYD